MHFLKQHTKQKRTDRNSKEVNPAKKIRVYHNHNGCAKCFGENKVPYGICENGEYLLNGSIAIAVKNFWENPSNRQQPFSLSRIKKRSNQSQRQALVTKNLGIFRNSFQQCCLPW